MSAPHFDEMSLPRPDVDKVGERYAAIKAGFNEATDTAGRASAIKEWDRVRSRLWSWISLTNLRFNQDTRDAERKAEREYCDSIRPKLQELDTNIMRGLLASDHRAEMEEEIGHQAFALWEAEIGTFAPEIEDDLVQEAKLEAEYVELLASAKIEFRGETYNLPGLGKFAEDPDRETRHDASKLSWGFFEKNAEQLDRIYDDLVKLRTKMAKKLGYENFIEMGYKRMSRVDYDQADVERFRAQVREQLVPLCVRIREKQREILGVDKLMSWDEPLHDLTGNPKPQGDHDWMLDRATEMFDEIGGGLDSFWRMMNERGLIDLKTREGKAGGGFCTSFPEYGVPFIYANFNGTQGDVGVFTHEMGHAFQNHMSHGLSPVDYHWPTSESCEIHSMSLEFLTWPGMDKFFGDDAEKFRKQHLMGALLFLPYGVAIDHFQHLVYAKPDATPEERHGMWREMIATYLPWRDYGDIAYGAKGARWQRQGHVYQSPFYYIDYTLAQVCALQYWIRAEADFDEALTSYVALCKRGGEAPFQELTKGAGLRSPFEDGALDEVVAKAAATLKI
ncbi:MAG: M3 family oligoendopeptidase [Planctomycetota bacterium]|jgi:M3 family oligoendopeptidase